MSKIVCEVCGTAYPEASAQCPICGCVRPVDAQPVASNAAAAAPERSYQHIKGGRFSEANVRKRNAGKQAPARPKPAKAAPAAAAPAVPAKKKKKKSSGNMGLLVTIFVLLLAIIAVIAYILIKFFLPAPEAKPEVTDPIVTDAPTDVVTETPVEVLCVDLVLDVYQISLDNAGDSAYITAMPEPFDTTEEILFESSDNSIVMAESDGRVTAVRKGQATVTVTCGAVSVQCTVSVGMPKFALNTDQIDFDKPGDTKTIYDGTIPMNQIMWSTDNPAVAMIINGIVTAVGGGSTTVYGVYNGEIHSCLVNCVFPTEAINDPTVIGGETTAASDPTVPPTEPISNEYKAPFSLKNKSGGRNDDVTVKVGDTFYLALVDSTGKEVKGVTWTVEGSRCTVSDGTVKAVRSGYCEIVATYGGQSYKCVVRIL